MTDVAWINASLTSARPQAIGALLRYFRDLDTAEEAYQEACMRALKTWPQNGPPRDAAAWLIFVGRNAAMDDVRRRVKQVALPDEAAISDLSDAEGELADRLDGEQYRHDILRLLFVGCHPQLPATHQIVTLAQEWADGFVGGGIDGSRQFAFLFAGFLGRSSQSTQFVIELLDVLGDFGEAGFGCPQL